MKKVLMVLGIGLVLLTGCSDNQKETVATDKKSEVVEKEVVEKEVVQDSVSKVENLNGVVEYFAENGYEVGFREKQVFTLIGAVDGDVVQINNQEVEIYEYKTNKEAEENQKTMVTQLDGSGEVVVNGKFMLIVFADHVDRDKLIESFKSFK